VSVSAAEAFTGTPLDRQIRRLEESQASRHVDFTVPVIKPGISGKAPSPFDNNHDLLTIDQKKQKTFNIYTAKYAGTGNNDFNKSQKDAVTAADLKAAASGGLQGLVAHNTGSSANKKSKKARPYSAGANRPGGGGLKAVRNARAGAIDSSGFFEDFEQSPRRGSSGGGRTGGRLRRTVSGSGNRDEEQGLMAARESFELLEDLHRLDGILF
jgi:hypothetical protein